MPLEELRLVRRLLGCSLNDLVLAIVTGAVRELFLRRHTSPESVDFQVTAPVSVRSEFEPGQMNSRLSNWILRLPIDQADPLEQVRALRAVTARLKESRRALGAELMLAAADWAPAFLLDLAARTLGRPLPAHLIVTNVPGPQRPLYMAGAEMLAAYPVVPLMPHTALAIGVLSYNGTLLLGPQLRSGAAARPMALRPRPGRVVRGAARGRSGAEAAGSRLVAAHGEAGAPDP